MSRVKLTYWAAARAAADCVEETIEADTVAAALISARSSHADPRFDAVLSASSLMSEGRVLHEADLEAGLDSDLDVDVLPPFAGGGA